ncbi:unnamed protein product [Sphenostylis stenocarpa]|uniref:MADS-box domain-containing protein n=1 Tax=Sphenostylis stenocarpa TaxID=92480 RepID=A0AA86VZ39_9FABA|nr:unnamed protein product [Sphenostylis stenocarpa]
MTRRKVKIAFIENDSARKTTYKKRKKGMLKKVEELSTLCGIDACAIVYGPGDLEPEVWPSRCGVQRVVGKFRNMPAVEKIKKMVNQESFIRQRIQKGNEQMMKLMKDNAEKELTLFMFQCLNHGRVFPDENNMNLADLNVLASVIEQNLVEIGKRLETLNVNQLEPNQQPQMQTPAFQPQLKATSYKTHFQTPSYQPHLQAPTYQPEMQMALMSSAHGLDMDANSMQRLLFMNLLNGSEDETMMPPFGDPNLQFQSDFWPNLGLSIVTVCYSLYNPFYPKPEVWASENGVHRVLGKFINMPELEQNKKMMNQESFIAQRIQKGNEHMKKLGKDNREKEMDMFMFQFL